jgi:hypothetical protein
MLYVLLSIWIVVTCMFLLDSSVLKSFDIATASHLAIVAGSSNYGLSLLEGTSCLTTICGYFDGRFFYVRKHSGRVRFNIQQISRLISRGDRSSFKRPGVTFKIFALILI